MLKCNKMLENKIQKTRFVSKRMVTDFYFKKANFSRIFTAVTFVFYSWLKYHEETYLFLLYKNTKKYRVKYRVDRKEIFNWIMSVDQ